MILVSHDVPNSFVTFEYEDASSTRKFYDQVVGYVRSAESMGEKFSSKTLGPVLVPFIVDKLPKGVVEKWELEIGDHKEDYVKVKTLFAFLEQLIRAKESSQPPSLQSKSPAQENSWNHGAHSKSNPSRKYSTSALCTTTQGRACIICGKNHWVWSCISFLSLPVKERFRKAVSKGLCFWCLESGHRAEVCQKPLCKYCRGKHHSLLHLEPVKSQPEEANSKSSEPPSSSATPPSSSSIVASSIAVNSGGKVILQTVPAVLCGSNGCKKVVRCFFDPGSQTSFVQQSVVEELGLDGETVRIAFSGFGRKSAKDTLRKRISFTLAPVGKPGKPQGVEALTAPVIWIAWISIIPCIQRCCERWS